MNTFTFPKNSYDVIKDRQNLIELIEMENKINESRIMYNYYDIKEQYLYAKCKYKGCHAELRFKRKDNSEIYQICKEN